MSIEMYQNADSTKRNQWGKIIDQNTRQYQKLKAIQREKDFTKKLAYKYALDKHLQQRYHNDNDLKQEERKVIQRMMQENARLQAEQKLKKKKLIQKLKMISDSNKKEIQIKRITPLRYDTNTSINIGQLELMQPQRKDQMKKMLKGYYQHQINEKKMQEQIEKMNDQETLKKQIEILNKRQEERQIQRAKMLKLGQKQYVFNYYKYLDQLNKKKQKQLQQKLIDKAKQQLKHRDQQKFKKEIQMKYKINQQIKQTLIDQISQHNNQKQQQKRRKNHQKIINRFSLQQDTKIPKIKKQDYLDYLLKQQQLQKQKRNEFKYLNEHQQKLNKNELNKFFNKKTLQSPTTSDASILKIGSNQRDIKKKDQIFFRSLGLDPQQFKYNVLNQDEIPANIRKSIDQSNARQKIRSNSIQVDRKRGQLANQGYNIMNSIYT